MSREYQIGSRSSFDFGEFIFDYTVKYPESYVVKLPIGSPSLISEIAISQKKDIMRVDDIVGIVLGKLKSSHMFF